MAATPSTLMALDVGGARIGVAIASLIARLPHPHVTLRQGPDFFSELDRIIETEAVGAIVVGYPRGMQSQHTAQTQAIETFTDQLREHTTLPIHFQDEALTSQKAKAELEARRKPYVRGDIDALAATYILEDFLLEHQEVAV